MNLLADEEGLTLNSQEREQLKQLADDYYASLTDADKAYIKASRDDVYTMYEPIIGPIAGGRADKGCEPGNQ